MATDPFSSGTIARLEDRTQGYRFNCIIGEVVVFRFWCCDQPPVLGVTKAPACILDVNPEVQCDNVNIAFDISNSYSPTGSLVGGLYEVDYGNGVTTGAIAWPGGGPAPWNYAYPAAGVYTVTAYVTDTLGVRGTTAMTVEIVDCANDTVLIEQMYALSATTGPWVKDVAAGGAPPPWTQCIIGLTGNWLVGRDLKLDPHRKHLNYGQRHVWMTSQSGPAKTENDMRIVNPLSWSRLYDLLPEPQDADGLGEVKANLDWWTIAFNPINRDEVYILAGTATRAWIYFSFDGGATWDSWQCRW